MTNPTGTTPGQSSMAYQPDLIYGDPCPVCGQDGWPADSAGNARRIHELARHGGDARIDPRWWHPKSPTP